MKQKAKLFAVVLSLFIVATSVERVSAQVRTQAPPEKMIPTVPFDEAAAKSALEEGTASITGVGCFIYERKVYLAGNRELKLYPDSPHLREWIKMGDKHGYAIVGMSPVAAKYYIAGSTDGGGRFQFTNLKPGTYFISGYHSVDFTSGFGQPFTVSRMLERFVEIKKESEQLKINLVSGSKATGVMSFTGRNCN